MSHRGIKDNFDARCTVTIDKLRVEIYANPNLLNVIVHRDTGVIFSTPRPDTTLNVGLLLGQVAGHDVYVIPQGRGSPIPWIYSREAVATLSSLDIKEGELLTVTMGGPEAILQSAGAEADGERLQRLVTLAQILPTGAAGAPLDQQALPADLRDLYLLLARWSISDDVRRSDVVSGADTAELRSLVERVERRLPLIAKFLSEPAGRNSDAAAALGALAESVMEAQHELRDRSKPSG
jgi:hypothetical protein